MVYLDIQIIPTMSDIIDKFPTTQEEEEKNPEDVKAEQRQSVVFSNE